MSNSKYSSNTFEIEGIQYSCGVLDAFTQLNASRKAAPLFIATARGLWFEALYSVEPEDLDYMLRLILPYIQRQDISGVWAPVYNKENKVCYFEDMTGATLIGILYNALVPYLDDFFLQVGLMVSSSNNQVQTPEEQE